MTADTPSGRPWAIYARLSDLKGEEQTSTASQIADCRRYADQHGLATSEAHVYEDIDLSAYKVAKVKRPAFEQMLKDLDARLVAGVLCWKIDRLVRSHRDFERVWEVLERRSGGFVSLHERFDSSTPSGEFALRTMVGIARMESQTIALRLRRGLQEQREQGKPHGGGHRPYGYQADFVTVNPAEAAVLREAHVRLLAGETLRSLVLDLNRRGLRTAEERPWSPTLLSRIITNPRMAGYRVHWRQLEDGRRRREVAAKGSWKPIFTQAEHEAIVALFADPARRAQVRQPRTHLLSGLARCGYPTPGGVELLPAIGEVCGGPMYAQAHGKGRPLDYRCLPPPTGSGCGRVTIMAPPVEELVAGAAIAFVDGPDLARLLERLGRDDEQGALAKDQEALEQLADDYYVTRLISREEYLKAREGLEAKLRQARVRLERAQGAGLLADLKGRSTPLAAEWDAYTVDQRRAVLEALFRAVVVLPAPRPGPRVAAKDRVRLAWRIEQPSSNQDNSHG